MYYYIIFGITYAFAAAMQPGPFQAYIIAQTIRNGWRSTFPAAFAPIVSDIPILTVILSLLSSVPANFILVLRLVGGVFLVYLGIHAFFTWLRYDASNLFSDEPDQKTFWTAVLVNLLNPNPYLGWSLIMGPFFLQGWRTTPAYGISMLVSFYLTLIISSAGIIILFSVARRLGPKICKALVGISAVALFAFGIYQIYLGIRSVTDT